METCLLSTRSDYANKINKVIENYLFDYTCDNNDKFQVANYYLSLDDKICMNTFCPIHANALAKAL